MRTLCYVSADGEVLSNKEHPVDKPTLVLPVLPEPRRVSTDHEAAMVETVIRKKLYYAVEISDSKP